MLVAVAFAGIAFAVAFGTGTSGGVEVTGGAAIERPAGSADGAAPAASGTVLASPDLVVEIVGAIAAPGVYHMPPGSRVGDLVTAAGGYGTRVDVDAASRNLNLAARLADGDQVRVPSRDDVTATGPSGTATGSGATRGGSSAAGPIDLNAATAEQLDALPGIGPATAAKIIAAREETRFTAIDDLRTRKLVGAKTFDGLRDLVTVR